LEDEFDQYVGSDGSSTATLSVTSSTTGTAYTPVLSGTTITTASKGMYKFESLTFKAEPDNNFSKIKYLIS
jgi:hypothetical protein